MALMAMVAAQLTAPPFPLDVHDGPVWAWFVGAVAQPVTARQARIVTIVIARMFNILAVAARGAGLVPK